MDIQEIKSATELGFQLADKTGVLDAIKESIIQRCPSGKVRRALYDRSIHLFEQGDLDYAVMKSLVSDITPEDYISIRSYEKFENYCEVVTGAINDLNARLSNDTKPLQLPPQEWWRHFGDKAEGIDDMDIKQAFSQLLSAEIMQRGNFSKRTINILAEMDSNDAKLFRSLCNTKIVRFRYLPEFAGQSLIRTDWNTHGNTPIPFIPDVRRVAEFTDNALNTESLMHLRDLGLINLHVSQPLILNMNEGDSTTFICDAAFVIAKATKSSSLPLGKIAFTTSGSQLSEIVEVEHKPGFKDFVEDYWRDHGFIVHNDLNRVVSISIRAYSIEYEKREGEWWYIIRNQHNGKNSGIIATGGGFKTRKEAESESENLMSAIESESENIISDIESNLR